MVFKIDMKNAFNSVSSQVLLDECAVHFPELFPWTAWCYGKHPSLWHPLGIISSESGVQQGDPLGPFFFCLVLQKILVAIAEDTACSGLLFHKWYLDDGVIAGSKPAVERALAIIQASGPPLGLCINLAKCELFSKVIPGTFPPDIKTSNMPNFEILGAPIGDFHFLFKIYCPKA